MTDRTNSAVQLKTHQEMPPMGDKTYSHLVEDIRKYGVEFPVIVDADTNEILDGHHRYQAAVEAGVEPKVEYRSFETEAERTMFTLRVNLLRRDLGPVGWGRLFEQLLEVRGVKTSRGPKEQQGNSVTITEIADEAGVSRSTAEKRLKLAKELEPYPETAAKVDSGDVTVKDALVAAAQEAEEKGIEPPVIPSKKIPEGQAAGYKTVQYYRKLIEFDPAEVALAHRSKHWSTQIDEEIQRSREVVAWFERFIVELERNNGLRAVE